ncbi:OmpA family protein [Pelagibaculum spongiae]|uniref:Flagellar motor protein MotB n=1 Tax=Pelagibaculum spongiae TaxID=2080658 RepID=A0A2V1GWQ0_9GAMM|nr:OmpA family protein [Pelagibaculum spongiae]PVZ69754.1 flagellar motor protein MotB [Pelagibaculum spongiae]
MAKFIKLVVAAFLVTMVSGCSIIPEISPQYRNCLIAGAVAGGAYQAIDNDGEGVGSGAAKGAALTGLLCAVATYRPEPKLSELDTDLDGVFDDKDVCPETPQIAKVDDSGCALDTDSDGVPDYRDDCRGTISIAKVSSRGCPLDSDQDRVPDYRDDCPLTKRGTPVNSRGCPRDSDNDGVKDLQDQCPNTERGVRVDKKGCELKAVSLQTFVEPLPWMSPVLFEIDSAALADKTVENLNRLADKLQGRSDYFLTVIGHADDTGSEQYNLDLSVRRAEAAETLLIELGVPAFRIQISGEGEHNPASANDNERGRKFNRRVEVEVEYESN